MKDLTPPTPLSGAERGEQDRNTTATRTNHQIKRSPPSPRRRGGRGGEVLFLLVLFAPLPAPADDQPTVTGLRVPAGFEITEFADSKLANDIHCLTVGP